MIFLLIMVTLVDAQVSAAFVNCHIACMKCHDATESLDFLEVYCSMCKECRDSRRLRLSNSDTTVDLAIAKHIYVPVRQARQKEEATTQSTTAVTNKEQDEVHVYSTSPIRQDEVHVRDPLIGGWPEGCPTPPICEEEEIEPLFKTKMRPTVTTSATCPPLPTCKPKTHTTPCCGVPMCGPSIGCGGSPAKLDVEIHFKDDYDKSYNPYKLKGERKETQSTTQATTCINAHICGAPNVNNNYNDIVTLKNFRPTPRIPDYSNNFRPMPKGPDYYYIYLGVPKNAFEY